MEFDRHTRVAAQIKDFAAAFISEEANTNPLITVMRVRISPDYRHATVFVTTIPDGKEADALIFLKRKGSELRQYIAKHSKMKILPHLDFEIDYGERHRQNIDRISSEIKAAQKSSETDEVRGGEPEFTDEE
jgi:ribosome-binding factor A